MWALAGPRLAQLLGGHAPVWLYLIYSALVASFVLVLGRCVLGRSTVAMSMSMFTRAWPWRSGAATAIALAFVLYRMLSAQTYAILGMPVAVVPWYLVAMGL